MNETQTPSQALEPALYLLPTLLGDTPCDRVLPAYNIALLSSIRHFIVEEIRTARRFLRRADRTFDIDACEFYPMGKHADAAAFKRYLQPLRDGKPMGVLSEAGWPTRVQIL